MFENARNSITFSTLAPASVASASPRVIEPPAVADASLDGADPR